MSIDKTIMNQNIQTFISTTSIAAPQSETKSKKVIQVEVKTARTQLEFCEKKSHRATMLSLKFLHFIVRHSYIP